MSRKGFTLIELLVVVIIIGVMTSIALPQYRKAMDRSKAAEAMGLLPAMYEARERWRILNGYHWDNGGVYDQEGNSPSLSMRLLDIETTGSDVLTACPYETSWETKNFCYTLVAGETTPACVKAVPKWGASRGLTGATIFYHGDTFSCSDESSNAACDILNIADSDHYYACE